MTTDTTFDKYRLRSTDLSWTSSGDEVIVLDLRTSEYLSSNGSGKLLWERLSHAASIEDLGDALVTVYGIDRDAALTDARAFVAGLTAHAMVEQVG